MKHKSIYTYIYIYIYMVFRKTSRSSSHGDELVVNARLKLVIEHEKCNSDKPPETVRSQGLLVFELINKTFASLADYGGQA